MEENIHRQSWWKRNWKWVVPSGGCLIIIVLIIVFIGSIFYGVTSLMTDSKAYTDAMEKATSSEQVTSILGSPIEQNGVIGGSIHYSSGYSDAEITIPIKGPNGAGTIRVEGGGTDDVWTYEKMDVLVSETGEIIDLLLPVISNDSLQ